MKRFILMLTPLIILVALLSLFAVNIDRDPSLVPSALINKPVPAFALSAVEGLPQPGFDQQTLMGQVSVVNVFASWCVPCRDEHPYLMELADWGDVALFGINHKDAAANAGKFLTELGNPYDYIGADVNGRVSLDWGVYGVPETFVVDKSGVITFKHVGPLSPEVIESALMPAIEAAAK